DRGTVTIDGKEVSGQLDRIHFIRRTALSTGVIEPPVELDIDSALLGLIFIYPIETLPQEVSLEWDLFSPRIQIVPGVATDETGGMPAELTPGDPQLKWINTLTNPTIPQQRVIAPPPPQATFSVPVLSCMLASFALGVLFALRRQGSSLGKMSKWTGGLLLGTLCGALLAFPFARVSFSNPFKAPPKLSQEDAGEIVTGLLHNIYRAFDRHNESLIYDRLAESISGELLQQVYLETRESMEVKDQGGLRISVNEVELTDLECVDPSGAEPTFRCRWHVAGEMGHWGHVHQRENVHTARVTIAPREEQWKIVGMEMLDEETAAGKPPTAGGAA
ncbi:MAG: hypothetical protein AAGF97_20460, partial [Planctomycetota bacterium]